MTADLDHRMGVQGGSLPIATHLGAWNGMDGSMGLFRQVPPMWYLNIPVSVSNQITNIDFVLTIALSQHVSDIFPLSITVSWIESWWAIGRYFEMRYYEKMSESFLQLEFPQLT